METGAIIGITCGTVGVVIIVGVLLLYFFVLRKRYFAFDITPSETDRPKAPHNPPLILHTHFAAFDGVNQGLRKGHDNIGSDVNSISDETVPDAVHRDEGAPDHRASYGDDFGHYQRISLIVPDRSSADNHSSPVSSPHDSPGQTELSPSATVTTSHKSIGQQDLGHYQKIDDIIPTDTTKDSSPTSHGQAYHWNQTSEPSRQNNDTKLQSEGSNHHILASDQRIPGPHTKTEDPYQTIGDPDGEAVNVDAHNRTASHQHNTDNFHHQIDDPYQKIDDVCGDMSDRESNKKPPPPPKLSSEDKKRILTGSNHDSPKPAIAPKPTASNLVGEDVREKSRSLPYKVGPKGDIYGLVDKTNTLTR